MRKTILLIDDNKSVVEIVRSLLRRNGFDVHYAYNAKDGWDQLVEHEIDVVVTDVMMPGVDGYEFVRKLREYEEFKTIPIIYLTALDSMEDEFEGFMAGGDAYLKKPFKARELLAKIDNVMQGPTASSSSSGRNVVVDGEARHALVLSSDERRRKEIAELLHFKGYRSDTVDATPTSLGLLDEGDYNLLIVQVSNEGFTDDDVIRFLRSFELNTPLVFIREQDVNISADGEQRAFAVVDLPVDVEKLGSICDRAIAAKV